MNATCDVAILGAGPAGLCAAIRLRQMGRKVTIVARAAPAHGSVGELLTPGVRAILDFLGVPDAMRQARGESVTSSRVIWPEQHVAISRPPVQQVGIMIDRALFDQQLLRSAFDEGANMRLSSVACMVRHSEGWRIGLDNNPDGQFIAARFVVDARGRVGSADGRVPLAPRLLAICCEFPAEQKTCEVSVEALEDGWLWGAPTSQGSYRVLAFGDPMRMRLKQAGHPSVWLQDMIYRSRLFPHLATMRTSRFGAYNATPYLHRDWLADHVLKVGDAALALDPLSSSGVEKSMRFALQGALAINTLLSNENGLPLARQYLESKVYESCGRHMAWTQEQYTKVWCAQGAPFWQERGAEQPLDGFSKSAARRIAQARIAARAALEISHLHPPAPSETFHPLQFLEKPVLAPGVGIMDIACAMGDFIVSKSAVTHPGLSAPVAFVHGREVAPLLREIGPSRSYAELIERWASRITMPDAIAICAWALREKLLLTT